MATLLHHVVSSVTVLCCLPILSVAIKTLHGFHHVSVYCRLGLESCSVSKIKSLLTACSAGYKGLEQHKWLEQQLQPSQNQYNVLKALRRGVAPYLLWTPRRRLGEARRRHTLT